MQHVYSTNLAFAALKSDGSVMSWGDIRFELCVLRFTTGRESKNNTAP